MIKLKCTWLVPVLLLLLMEIQLYNCLKKQAKPEDITNALRKAMAYYNCSLNLDEKLDILLKIYDPETNEDLQSAKKKVLPPDYITLDAELKALESDYGNEYVSTTEVIDKVLDIDSRFEKLKNMVLQTDAIVGNLRTIEKLHTDTKSINEDFEHYAIIQNQFFSVYRVLNDSGINLAQPGEKQVEVRLVDKEKFEELLTKYKNSDDLAETTWGTFYRTGIVRRSAPLANELKLLEKIMHATDSGDEDQLKTLLKTNEETLKTFIPMLNKRVLLIVEKTKFLEQAVDILDQESQDYSNFFWGYKDKIGERLKKLKSLMDLGQTKKDEL